MLCEGLDKVIIIFFADIFDAEVFDDKGEYNVTRRMLPEVGAAGDRSISKLGEVDIQPVIGNAAGLFETRHAFANLHIDPAGRTDKSAQVVLLNDLVQKVSGHGGAVVEIFDFQRQKPGIRG